MNDMNGLADQPERSSKSRRRPARSIRWALGLLAALVLLTALLAVAGQMLHWSAADLATWQTRMWRFKLVGISVQLLVLAVAGWRWPAVVAWALRRGLIGQRQQAAALAVRDKALLLVLLFVVAVGIGPGDLMRLAHAFTN